MSDDLYNDKSKKKDDSESFVVQNIMRTEAGRSYMWKHLQLCGVYESIFDADTHKHAYRSGLRQAGLQIERDLKEFAPGYYLKMIEENING